VGSTATPGTTGTVKFSAPGYEDGVVNVTVGQPTNFFIDPTNGNDAFPGTAAQPWKTVEKALDINESSGLKVAEVAGAGNNVVVTILGGTKTETVSGAADISTPVLLAGSVTVLQAPFPKTFTLDLGTKQLTLNRGYKLQDINITSNLNAAGKAVTITHPTAGLASVDVTCNATVNNIICVWVEGAGSHTLKGVRVDVTDATAGNFGIKSNDANVNLSIVGGRVRPTGANANPVTLIDSKGVLTVTGLTVDMTKGGHAQISTGIVLRAPGSLVTSSTINVSNNTSAKGIKVENAASKSTVEGNTFTASGAGIGVDGDNNLFSSALPINNFLGTFTNKVQ
jgi:hypothetical protein